MITLIATTYRANNTLAANWKANNELLRMLKGVNGVTGIVEVLGSFKELGQEAASQEISYKFEVSNNRLARYLAFVICNKYQQDAVLMIDGTICYLLEVDGDYLKHLELGKWSRISEKEALEFDCYTLDKAGVYWSAK